MSKRNFKDWLSSFRDSISNYKYYTDFNNVYKNANKYKVELNILNSLIGSKDIQNDFLNLIKDYPNVLRAIPTLIAKRESEIFCMDKTGSFTYNFKNRNLSVKQYSYFMKETGLFDLISNHLVANLYDYVLGINTGLDSNGRKNRGGHLMEELVESYIKPLKLEYYKEMWSDEVEKKFKINLSPMTNNGQARKRFDYVVKGKSGTIYGIECNFYSTQGSKLNETARSYKMIAKECKKIKRFKFIWFTDGKGWSTAANNLKETFDVLDDIYNIKELESGIAKKIIK